jgi:hypothetical protein
MQEDLGRGQAAGGGSRQHGSFVWRAQGYVVKGKPAETRGGFWPRTTWVRSGFRQQEGVERCCLQRCAWPGKEMARSSWGTLVAWLV